MIKHCVATATVTIAPREKKKKEKKLRDNIIGVGKTDGCDVLLRHTSYITEFCSDSTKTIPCVSGGGRYNLYCRWIVIPG